MKRFHGTHWGDHVQKRIVRRFEQFGDIVHSRVLSTFEGINEEATALEKQRYQEFMSSFEFNGGDSSEAEQAMQDLAFNEAMDYAVTLSSMRFTTLNLFSAALYHLTEQHLIDLGLQIQNDDERHNLRPEQAITWFKDTVGLDVANLHSWPLIAELKLVANVVKHGEGESADRLREKRPDLFVAPSLRNEEIRIGTRRIEPVLFGQEFFVTTDDFSKYHKCSVAFWTEFGEALSKLAR
jgi:hypothetical protein